MQFISCGSHHPDACDQSRADSAGTSACKHKRLLSTTEKHKAIRDEADQQYLKNTMKMKKYAKQKNVRMFSVGDNVSVKIPRIDRTSTDISRVPCVVVEVVGKAKDLYRLRCRSRVLSVCFNAGDLEHFSGQFKIPVYGWQDIPQITLRSASMEQSPSIMCRQKFAVIATFALTKGVHV